MEVSNIYELVNRLKHGDHIAFEIIYRIYYKRLLFFARSYVLDQDDTNDLLQNVFTKLWVNRSSLKDTTNLQAWLFTVTKNETLALLKKIKVRNEYKLSHSNKLLDLNYTALQHIDYSGIEITEMIDIIHEALLTLTPNCKRAFECSRFQRMHNHEIAKEMGLSVKTVEAYITKALKVIRLSLSDYLHIIILLSIIF